MLVLINDRMDNKIVYDIFDWSKINHSFLKEKIEKIIECIPTNVSTIIDIGCGNGVITNVLGNIYEVLGVDRSENALKTVETEKISASSDAVPLPDKSFDLVLSSELLEHLNDEDLMGTVREIKRLSKKYIFITVPNDENPDKLSIKCPNCSYIYNSPNHLRSFNTNSFRVLFPEYNILNAFTFVKKVRYYNKAILKVKRKFTPHFSWIPYYWIPRNRRATICPKCEHEYEYPYRFNPIATFLDIFNIIISPKKHCWLFVLMEKK